MTNSPETHQVAANAYLICADRFLLLKRATPPLIWGPPGGRLYQNEDPVTGLRREVLEETGINVEVHQPVTTWFGQFRENLLLSIDYLCTTREKKVVLSGEHSDFRWLSIQTLHKDQHVYFQPDVGFKLTHFNLAWQIFQMKQYRLQ